MINEVMGIAMEKSEKNDELLKTLDIRKLSW